LPQPGRREVPAYRGRGLLAEPRRARVIIAGLLLYLYVAEPFLSHITALASVTAYLPGVAADGLTQASLAGRAAAAGLMFTAWAAAIACAGAVAVAHWDIA
jgi:hypothetical protein